MTVQQALAQAISRLNAAGISSSRIDAELLLALTLGHDRSWIQAHSADRIGSSELKKLEKSVERRSKREPLDHITGQREFYGLSFRVSSDVLSPRIETEPIVDLVNKNAPRDSRLIDVGTGCGALAIAIAKNRPDLDITAADISQGALKVARQNVKNHTVNLKLVESDLFKNVQGRFQTVVANLPYLRNDTDLTPEVKQEPAIALLGGSDGLAVYRKFIDQLPDHLETGGQVYIEADPWQHPELTKLTRAKGLSLDYQDYFILGFTGSGELLRA